MDGARARRERLRQGVLRMALVGDTKLRILEHLRTRRACAGELSEVLSISKVAIHRHLDDLMREGLVRSSPEKCVGRGRPKMKFVAVDEQATYAQLCDDVFSHLKQLYGSDMVLEVLYGRNQKTVDELRPQLEGLELEEKLYRLTEYLTERGYQASYYRQGEHFYLEQGRCPKLALSAQHGELCQAELEMYQQLLGVKVVREERIASGGNCCRYRIEPASRSHSVSR